MERATERTDRPLSPRVGNIVEEDCSVSCHVKEDGPALIVRAALHMYFIQKTYSGRAHPAHDCWKKREKSASTTVVTWTLHQRRLQDCVVFGSCMSMLCVNQHCGRCYVGELNRGGEAWKVNFRGAPRDRRIALHPYEFHPSGLHPSVNRTSRNNTCSRAGRSS